MSLAGNPVAGMKTAYFAAHLDDLAGILVTHGHGYRHRLLSPSIPVVDVHVGAANGGAMHFDEYVVVSHGGFRNVLHPNPRFGACLDQRFHSLSLLNDAEMTPGASEGLNDAVELRGGVRCIHLRANSRLSVGD